MQSILNPGSRRAQCSAAFSMSRHLRYSHVMIPASKAKGMTMKALVIFTAVCYSTSAYAQAAPPKASNKPAMQVRPKEPMGCKLVGRVNGTKLWAGDCVGPELRGAIPSTETQSMPEPPTGAIPPDQKQ